MEHGVYLCAWKRARGKIAIWVRAAPTLHAEAPTYAEAEELLLEAILDAGGATQAVLEFQPPLPRSALEARYTRPELFLIGGDAEFQTDAPRSQAFETPEERELRLRCSDRMFVKPICRACYHASTQRSPTPLTLTVAPVREDGAFGYVGHHAGTSIQIVSREFVDLLTPAERAGLQFREVDQPARGRTFYELLGPGGAGPVGVNGLQLSGWRCANCNHCTWGYWIQGLAIDTFICREDLSPDTPGVFTIGTPPGVQLVATATRWSELVGKRGTRGFVSRRLGVVSATSTNKGVCDTLPLLAHGS
jgi:hypothetical protein